MKASKGSDRDFVDQQHKVRGLVAAFRERRYIKAGSIRPSARFRQGLRRLLLESRAVLRGLQFGEFLSWANRFIDSQIPDLAQLPIGYEELSGVIERIPAVSLEQELLWITARIIADVEKLNAFRSVEEEIERAVFSGRIDDAIGLVENLERVFGVSLWSVQLRIALEHQAGGLERQKRYTAEVRKIYRRGLLGFVAYYTSVRNEDRTTLAKYTDDIRMRIDKHPYFHASLKTYMRYRMALQWPVSPTGFAEILRVEQSHSIIDIYETFVAVVQEALRREGFDDVRSMLSACLHQLTEVNDFRLKKAALILHGTVGAKRLPTRDTNVSDALFVGKIPLGGNTARRQIRFAHVIDVWQLIYAGMVFAHVEHPKPRDLKRPKDAFRLIALIGGKRQAFDESFAQLSKMATNLRGIVSCAGLLDWLRQTHRSRPDDPWKPWLVGMNSPTLGVEDFIPGTEITAFQDTGEGNRFGATEATWRYLHEVESNWSGERLVAADVFKAARLIRERDEPLAAEILEEQIERFNGPLRSIASSLLLHCQFGSGHRHRVIELIADEGTRSETYGRMLPVIPSLESYVWADYRNSSVALAAPIALHLLWTSNDAAATLSLLRFVTGVFVRQSGSIHPSKLFDHADRYARHQLVYFLREVCVPHILDATRVVKSSKEVTAERQAICAALRLLDPANAYIYEAEVSSIANQAALEEGQWIVDRTRVHVDTAAFSRWAVKEIAEDYARYRDLLEVTVTSRQNFDDVIRELLSAGSSQRTAFKPEGEADALLVSMLHRLSDEFLNNPSFGLDFYLSKRIRHQSFIGLIRGPLEFAHLITTRESESGGYHRNSYWIDKFDLCNVDTKNALSDAFAKCATKFDETLIAAKDSRFHVRAQDKPMGLLAIDLPPQFLELASIVARIDLTLNEFMATAVAILWAALEPSLQSARRFVSDELKTKIAECFDELRAAVRRRAEHDPAFLEFDLAVGRSSAEVQRALDDAATWFVRADIEASKRQFRLDQVVKIAVDSALKCQRAFEPNIVRDVTEGDLQMEASTLIFVHDVLLVALDNVRAHSGLAKPKIHVDVRPNLADGTIAIDVRSDCKSTNRAASKAKIDEIRQLIKEGSAGPRTRAEGGSGFLKLAADVQQSSKGRIEFDFTEAGQFQLTVVYSLIVQPMEPRSTERATDDESDEAVESA